MNYQRIIRNFTIIWLQKLARNTRSYTQNYKYKKSRVGTIKHMIQVGREDDKEFDEQMGEDVSDDSQGSDDDDDYPPIFKENPPSSPL